MHIPAAKYSRHFDIWNISNAKYGGAPPCNDYLLTLLMIARLIFVRTSLKALGKGTLWTAFQVFCLCGTEAIAACTGRLIKSACMRKQQVSPTFYSFLLETCSHLMEMRHFLSTTRSLCSTSSSCIEKYAPTIKQGMRNTTINSGQRKEQVDWKGEARQRRIWHCPRLGFALHVILSHVEVCNRCDLGIKRGWIQGIITSVGTEYSSHTEISPYLWGVDMQKTELEFIWLAMHSI